jgi:Ulp1 family protease
LFADLGKKTHSLKAKNYKHRPTQWSPGISDSNAAQVKDNQHNKSQSTVRGSKRRDSSDEVFSKERDPRLKPNDQKTDIAARFKQTFSRKENIKVHFLGAWCVSTYFPIRIALG